MRESGFGSKSHTERLKPYPRALRCVCERECSWTQMYVTLQFTYIHHHSRVLRLCVQLQHTHTASGHTQSLHFKDSTPLFCYTVSVESQLHSNKISRTGGGLRGVFWVLNNVRREEKILLLFVSHAGHDPQCSKTLVIDKGQGNVILHSARKRDWIFGWIFISRMPTQVQVNGNVAPYLLDV